MFGQVASLVIADLRVAESGGAEDASREVRWVSGSGPRRKRIRLNRKPPAHSCSISATSGRDYVMWGFQLFPMLIVKEASRSA